MSFAYTPIQLTGTSSSGGSGGSAGAGRITVGSQGALFTTVSDAIAASYNIISVVSSVTENQIINVPSSGLILSIDPDATLNMGSGYFSMGSGSLDVDGGGTLSFGYSSPTTLFNALDGGVAKLSVSSITIDNNSSSAMCLTNTVYARFSNIIFDGDVWICGDSNVYEGCVYKNSSIFLTNSVDNTIIDGSVFEGVTVVDSGNNTVISDSVVY